MTAARSPLLDWDSSDRPRRMVSPGLESAIEQFASPELLSDGKVNIIALDAVVQRFGARWPMRREHVHAHVHANLERNIGNHGYFLRVSDTDVLICQPDLGRHAAQAACLRYLRDILVHFLGQNELSDLNVHEVLAVSSDGIVAQRLDPAQITAAALAGPSGATAAPPPTPRGIHQWTPFVSAAGRPVQVSCELEPVHELRGLSCIGVRVSRTATYLDEGRDLSPEEYSALPLCDIVRVDLATISAGLAGLRAEGGAGRESSLTLPIAAASLSSLKSRAQIVSAFKEAKTFVRLGVICQLNAVDTIPPSILLETCSLIRPFSLVVLGEVRHPASLNLRQLKNSGLNGLAMDCPAMPSDPEFASWARPLIAAARRVATSVIIHGLGSISRARLAAELGASHGTIRSTRILEIE